MQSWRRLIEPVFRVEILVWQSVPMITVDIEVLRDMETARYIIHTNVIDSLSEILQVFAIIITRVSGRFSLHNFPCLQHKSIVNARNSAKNFHNKIKSKIFFKAMYYLPGSYLTEIFFATTRVYAEKCR